MSIALTTQCKHHLSAREPKQTLRQTTFYEDFRSFWYNVYNIHACMNLNAKKLIKNIARIVKRVSGMKERIPSKKKSSHKPKKNNKNAQACHHHLALWCIAASKGKLLHKSKKTPQQWRQRWWSRELSVVFLYIFSLHYWPSFLLPKGE